jgi:hypothetical protein
MGPNVWDFGYSGTSKHSRLLAKAGAPQRTRNVIATVRGLQNSLALLAIRMLAFTSAVVHADAGWGFGGTKQETNGC